jgi:TetR/AcrR family transcriptional regulator
VSFRAAFEHRDALLASAVAAFVAQGFEGASLNAILATAGMSKGQFYHHFEGKQGLYLAVCEAMIDRKRAWLAAHPPPSADDPFDAIGVSLRAGLAFARANPDLDAFGRAFLRERGRPVFDAVVRTFPLTVDASLQAAVSRGLAAGAFAASFTPGFVVRAVAVVLGGAADLLEADDPEAGVEQVVALLRRGLGTAARD